MGTADVIPGVSGGTIAFITGIYEKLVESINNINLQTFKLLFTLKFKELEKQINLSFLLTLVAGVFVAAFSFAKLVQFLLLNYQVLVWSFFLGLVAASAVVVVKHVKNWNATKVILLLSGIIIAYTITSASVMRTSDTLLNTFLAGAIAIIAMILPGISGSFVLVILDKYRYIIDVMSGISSGVKSMLTSLMSANMADFWQAWGQTSFMPFIIFELGTLSGIIAFSKILNWLLKKYHDFTIAILTGFMIGSLNKVWPWKITLSTYTNSKGEMVPLLEKNILPDTLGNQFFLAIILMIVGFALVYIIERFSNQKASQ